MTERAKRVLWLHTHSKWREFEIPMLNSLGYEVWTAKKMTGLRSESADFSCDDHLTLSAETLNRLNDIDFHSGVVSPEAVRDMNDNFCAAFIPPHDPFVIKAILAKFTGKIILRVPGREHPKTYTEQITEFLPTIQRLGSRFWFSTAPPGGFNFKRDDMAVIEGPVLRDQSMLLPLGFSPTYSPDVWTGGGGNMVFFCPEINSNPYYTDIYKKFVRDFSDVPYVIGGTQQVPVVDPRVLGFIPRKDLDSVMRRSEIMFYHSREPRHCHYHPFEAMAMGMPVVYMNGGILERIGGRDQPGGCDTIEQARTKVIRLARGDADLSDNIRVRQREISETMTFEACKKSWQDRLPDILR